MPKKTLIITNGDGAVHVMKAAKIKADFLPWRDVLHQGPVPDNLPLKELSLVRAEYLSSLGWGEKSALIQDFKSRDEKLYNFKIYDKVILWFEHDLYDQLQILQILSFFAATTMEQTKLTIICRDQYLGRQSPDQLKKMMIYEQDVTKAQLSLAQKAWHGFRQSSSDEWRALLKIDISCLPFLKEAVKRMIEEYPSEKTGLSRTEREILKILSKGDCSFKKLFLSYQETEEREFMGDGSFKVILNNLLKNSPALLKILDGDDIIFSFENKQVISITPDGIKILQVKNKLKYKPFSKKWIGGLKF